MPFGELSAFHSNILIKSNYKVEWMNDWPLGPLKGKNAASENISFV